MKKLIYLLLFIFLFNISSCNEKMLDVKPLGEISELDVWKDPVLIEAYLNEIYRGLGHGLYETMMSSHTDESYFTHNYGTAQIVQSILTSSDIGNWNDNNRNAHFRWDALYSNIRNCNIFLEKINTTPAGDEVKKNRMTGEVYFLRAYFYHNLVRLFGGVPLVTKAYSLNDDFLVQRNTLEECINFITEDCDKSAELLPLQQIGNDRGRATKGAALALKSRMLLYAASDLYNNASWTTEYSNPELISYVTGDRKARWQVAKNAAKAVIDLGVYNLYKSIPTPGDSIAKNYAEIFLLKENQEAIFSRFFLTIRGNDGYHPGLHNGPNGYRNWAGNTPIQELVDDYEMKDGTEFSWNNPAHSEDPYKNRDPRFYASILYDGAKWRKRPSDVIDKDPVGIIQTGYYEKWNAKDNKIDLVPGLDTRKGPVENWNGSYSGYYLRKFIDPNVDAQYTRQEAPWHFFRYGEILLNYAEACIGLGEEAEARNYINVIRKRAGMPEINESGEALVKRYRNERRVELAFEEHRYFDLRRWMTAPEELNRNASGIDIQAKLNPDKVTSVYTYKTVKIQDRKWDNKLFFLPILKSEIEKNVKLVQNPGY